MITPLLLSSSNQQQSNERSSQTSSSTISSDNSSLSSLPRLSQDDHHHSQFHDHNNSNSSHDSSSSSSLNGGSFKISIDQPSQSSHNQQLSSENDENIFTWKSWFSVSEFYVVGFIYMMTRLIVNLRFWDKERENDGRWIEIWDMR